MMQKRNIKKTLLELTIIVLALVCNIENVHADGTFVGGDTTVPISNGSGGGGGNYAPTPHPDGDGSVGPGGSCKREYCKVSRYASISSKVYVNMYDMYGNKIENVLAPTTTFLAGTFVGFNIYEKNTFFSWATYVYTFYKKKCICIKNHKYCIEYNESGTVCKSYGEYTTEHAQDCNCDGYDGGSCSWKSGAGNEGACAAQATPWSYELEAHLYDLNYNDSNDINTTAPSSDRYNTMGNSALENCNDDYEEEVTINQDEKVEEKLNGTAGWQCETGYNRQDACINVKNGKVTYKLDKNGKCLADEYKVTAEYDENGDFKYWKYFIPLNANSKDGFSLYMNGKTEVLGVLCQEVIKNYEDYTDKIAKKDGSKLSGNSENDLKEVENGCIFQSVIKIPVKQRFYNELEDGKTFKGFNFYYRPIDINNTFPNGLTDTSIWYDWYESDYKDLDITESYKEITYFANTSGNENLIRKYNELSENQYASWDKMQVSGVSNYIENGGIINRYVDRDDFYPLGCGPVNSTGDVKNVFYQQECVRK